VTLNVDTVLLLLAALCFALAALSVTLHPRLNLVALGLLLWVATLLL
jgi:hypothetical protein